MDVPGVWRSGKLGSFQLFKTSVSWKLRWRHYGQGLSYNFLDAALALPPFSITLPLTLKVPKKLKLYGLYVYYVVLICDFGMLRVKFQFHCLGSATGLATDLWKAQATTHRKYIHQVKSVVIFDHVTNDVILKVGISCQDSSVVLP